MDRNSRNEAENVHFPSRMKKQNSERKLVHSAGDSAENNDLRLNQNTSKATFVAKNVKSKVEIQGPKERENSSKENKNNTTATNYSQNSSKNFGDVKNLPVMKKSYQKKMNSKKSFRKKFENQGIEARIIPEELNDTFEFEDIINNSRALELIQDLVNCFTFNSTLPEKELNTLRTTLFEKTCYALSSILNSCVKKIFNKVINSDFFQEFTKKHVSKKDACCQTSLSDIIEVVGTEKQNVSPCLDVIF